MISTHLSLSRISHAEQLFALRNSCDQECAGFPLSIFPRLKDPTSLWDVCGIPGLSGPGLPGSSLWSVFPSWHSTLASGCQINPLLFTLFFCCQCITSFLLKLYDNKRSNIGLALAHLMKSLENVPMPFFEGVSRRHPSSLLPSLSHHITYLLIITCGYLN